MNWWQPVRTCTCNYSEYLATSLHQCITIEAYSCTSRVALVYALWDCSSQSTTLDWSNITLSRSWTSSQCFMTMTVVWSLNFTEAGWIGVLFVKGSANTVYCTLVSTTGDLEITLQHGTHVRRSMDTRATHSDQDRKPGMPSDHAESSYHTALSPRLWPSFVGVHTPRQQKRRAECPMLYPHDLDRWSVGSHCSTLSRDFALDHWVGRNRVGDRDQPDQSKLYWALISVLPCFWL